MAKQTIDLILPQTLAILNHYGFDLRSQTSQELLEKWEQTYSSLWIRLAVIEALYQGRYKSISIEQILRHWLRKGSPSIHFNSEFEALICQDLPYGEQEVKLISQLSSQEENSSRGISQFIPMIDQSQCYLKLRETVQKVLEETGKKETQKPQPLGESS